MVGVEQEIFYVNTDTDLVRGAKIKSEVFQAIRALDFRQKEVFDLNAAMKYCINLKSLVPDYSWKFRWDLRSSTEEGNTNHAAFLEYLMAGLESFLIQKDLANKDLLQTNVIKVSDLQIFYLKDFHFSQEAKIDFFEEASGVYNFLFTGFGKDKSLAGGKVTMNFRWY